MSSVFVLHHWYIDDERDESKFIGVYSSKNEAQNAINRLKSKPGFLRFPDAFHIEEYAINKDHWSDGFSSMVLVNAKDKTGNWVAIHATEHDNNIYEVVESAADDYLDDLLNGDLVRCECLDGVLYVKEKVTKI